MIQLKHVLLILGGTLLSIGLLIGFLPVKQSGIGCGSAFTGASDDAAVADMTQAMIGRQTSIRTDCEDSLSGRRAPALALTIPGAILLTIGAGQTLTTPKGARIGNA